MRLVEELLKPLSEKNRKILHNAVASNLSSMWEKIFYMGCIILE